MPINKLLVLVVSVLAFFGSDAYAVYDAGTGRWLQRDPLVFVDGSNLYQYVLSSPAVFLDPYGRKACCGPSVDSQFAGEVNRHSKFFSNNAREIGPLMRPLFFKGYAKDIPYKWTDFGSDCPDDQGEGCTGTVSLCGTCIDKSELGNIMFGAIGKQFLRSGGLVLGGGRRGGRPGGINSPEDLAGAFGGIMLGTKGDLGSMDSASMCQLLRGDYTSEHNEARTVFDEEYRKLFNQVDPADVLGTMGAKKAHCGDCGTGAYDGAQSDFSTLDGQKTGNGIPWRDVYKDMLITWPGDQMKDPCCKDD